MAMMKSDKDEKISSIRCCIPIVHVHLDILIL